MDMQTITGVVIFGVSWGAGCFVAGASVVSWHYGRSASTRASQDYAEGFYDGMEEAARESSEGNR